MKKSAVVPIMLVLATLGCSHSSAPGREATPGDILGASVGSVEIDGQTVAMTASYVVVAEGLPLTVIGVLSDPGATVDAIWFLSGTVLESDDTPDACFMPDRSCTQYDTSVNYEAGREFVVALDVRDSHDAVHRVRSDWVTLISAP